MWGHEQQEVASAKVQVIQCCVIFLSILQTHHNPQLHKSVFSTPDKSNLQGTHGKCVRYMQHFRITQAAIVQRAYTDLYFCIGTADIMHGSFPFNFTQNLLLFSFQRKPKARAFNTLSNCSKSLVMQALNAYVKVKVNQIKLVLGKTPNQIGLTHPRMILKKLSRIHHRANDWIQGSTKLWPLLSRGLP